MTDLRADMTALLALPEHDLFDGVSLTKGGRYCGTLDGYSDDAMRAYALAHVAAERERCARRVEQYGGAWDDAAAAFAAAIREAKP